MKSTWMYLAGAGLILTLAMLGLVLWDQPGPARVSDVRPTPGRPKVPPLPPPPPDLDENPPLRPARPAPVSASGGSSMSTEEFPLPPSGKFALQSDEDRRRLGEAAFRDMDALYTRGRRPRGNPEAMKAMEELLQKYPDSHRAGCAAYELGQHKLKDENKPMQTRVEAAEPYLLQARNKHAEAVCDGDVGAKNMASMALALEVYRYTDRRRADALLDELSELPDTELDHAGRPISEKARQMKGHLPPVPSTWDSSSGKK